LWLRRSASPTVITYGSVNPYARARLLHELTHDLFERNFGAAPTWLNEGWAEYYSTLRVVNGKLEIGAALPDMTFTTESSPFVGHFEGRQIVAIPIASVAPPSRLLTMSGEEFYRWSDNQEPELEETLRRTGNYLGAWSFVHLLQDGENPYAKRFQVFLSEARTSRVEEAWVRVFGDVDFGELDRYFRSYLAKGRLTVFTVPYVDHVGNTVPKGRPMTDGEVHLLWAQLLSARIGEGKQAMANVKRELNAATLSHPELVEVHHYVGLVAMAEHRWDDAAAAFERAAKLAPQEPRYLFSQLRLSIARREGKLEPSEFEKLLPKLEQLVLVAKTAPQLMLASTYHLARGDEQGALNLAERAVKRDPIDPQFLDSYASILESVGRQQEALDVASRALAFVSESDREQGRRIRAHLRRLEQRAGP
jgi:tetratricopeptide (TPR) repeat protein